MMLLLRMSNMFHARKKNIDQFLDSNGMQWTVWVWPCQHVSAAVLVCCNTDRLIQHWRCTVPTNVQVDHWGHGWGQGIPWICDRFLVVLVAPWNRTYVCPFLASTFVEVRKKKTCSFHRHKSHRSWSWKETRYDETPVCKFVWRMWYERSALIPYIQ